MNPIVDAISDYCALLAVQSKRVQVYGSASFDFEINRRFARVFRKDFDQRSVVTFVELSSGDLYHADSWKKRGRRTGLNVLYRHEMSVIPGVKP